MINYKNPLIFIVNNNPTYNLLLAKFLGINGYSNIGIYRNGEECIKQMSAKPDIIVLDYLLPGKNGLEILSEIRKINPDGHIVFLSGQPDIEIALNAIKQGAVDYVVKNQLAFDRLIRKIDNLCLIAEKLQKNQKIRRNLYVFLVVYLLVFIFLIILYYAAG
jgi:DNA-binding NarL/FixJ family response regulator